jgi:GNAT superfamily N-acetyltransferase
VVFFTALGPDGTLIGSVRAEPHAATVAIGRLIVSETALRRGVGTALMRALEDAFPQAERFELFTGAAATEPLTLYAKLGYQVCRTAREGDVDLVWLEKRA